MKQFFSLILIVTIISCKKSQPCQNWIVDELCSPNSYRIACQGDEINKKIIVCGDDLKDAVIGNSIIIRDDYEFRIVRTYIRRF